MHLSDEEQRILDHLRQTTDETDVDEAVLRVVRMNLQRQPHPDRALSDRVPAARSTSTPARRPFPGGAAGARPIADHEVVRLLLPPARKAKREDWVAAEKASRAWVVQLHSAGG